jgi:SAM-dependent methyltransferase
MSQGGKTSLVLYLAVFVLFLHAIFQQRIISNIRHEMSMSIAAGPTHSRSMPHGSVDYYLTTRSPPNLPSVPLIGEEEERAKQIRNMNGIYGGQKDGLHLGGFTEIDPMGISHNLWHFMLGPLAIKSVVDVGCGRGHSTSFFLKQGVKVLCVEGSHDAVTHSLLPLNLIVEHDFSRGAWWPEDTYDAVWSVEFLEHVARPYMNNYLPIFKKSALLFVTSSAWGGWHHVEVHEEWWWISRMTAAGFLYSPELTDLVRLQASNGTKVILNKFYWY